MIDRRAIEIAVRDVLWDEERSRYWVEAAKGVNKRQLSLTDEEHLSEEIVAAVMRVLEAAA